jgi:hypothetical protein
MNAACTALGRGLVAGLAGTAAMTLSSAIEAKASGREPSSAPADAVAAVARVQPKDETGQSRLNAAAHWGYGTSWGIARAVLDLLGLRGPVATAAHFGAVLGAEQALLPALGVAKPAPAYGAAAAAADALHHAVYACACGLAYDYLAGR